MAVLRFLRREAVIAPPFRRGRLAQRRTLSASPAVRKNNQSKPALAQYLHALAAIKIIPILAGRRTGQNRLVDVGATGWLAFMAAHHNQSIL